jgi:hypothetical protein
VQRRRTGARVLVTVFDDARALLESVIEHAFVGIRTLASFQEVQGACTDSEEETEEEKEGGGFIANAIND